MVTDSATTVLGEHGTTLEDWLKARTLNKQKLRDVTARLFNHVNTSDWGSEPLQVTAQHSPDWEAPRYVREARRGVRRIELMFEIAAESVTGSRKFTTGISLTDEGLRIKGTLSMEEQPYGGHC